MKKAILFYSQMYDSEIEKDLLGLEKHLNKKGFALETCIICKDPVKAEEFKIMHSPALILIVNGRETERFIGAPSDMIACMSRIK